MRSREGRAWHVALGIAASRIAGFARDVVLAYFLGSSRFADLWYLGLRTPNVIQNLLGEGTLSSSFIPVYSRMLAEGRRADAARLAGASLGLVAVIAFGLALLGSACAGWIVDLAYPRLDVASGELLVRMLRVLFPMTAVLVVSAWALGILNSHGRHLVSYSAPILWNVAILGAAGLGSGALGTVGLEQGGARFVVWLTWGALAGSLAQTLVQVPWILREVRTVRPSLDWSVPGLAEVRGNFGPAVLGRGVVNLSGLLDAVLAALLVQGAVAHLSRATTLYLLPLSIFAMAVSAAELPRLARMGAHEVEAVSRRLRTALETLSFWLVASAVGYLVIGDLIVEAVFQRGDFTADDTRAVSLVLGAYALGLLASGRSRLLVSGFYAFNDTRTPAWVATGRVVVSTAVGVGLMVPLDQYGVGAVRFGAAGLALGSAVGAWVEYAWLRRRLGLRLPGYLPSSGTLLRLFSAAGLATAWVVVLRALGEPTVRTALPEAWRGITLAAGTALAFGVVYLLAARAFGAAVPLRRLRA